MYVYICVCIYIYNDVMTTIQQSNAPILLINNGFVATCRLWTTSGGVHALLVLEPTECSTNTRLEAYVCICSLMCWVIADVGCVFHFGTSEIR